MTGMHKSRAPGRSGV